MTKRSLTVRPRIETKNMEMMRDEQGYDHKRFHVYQYNS